METDQTPQKEIKWYFSLFSGKVFFVDADENLDVFQIPLKENPGNKNTCRKCYGRFYTDYNLTSRHYTPCAKCLKKYADLDMMRLKKNSNGKN